jgi:hypothetical protein
MIADPSTVAVGFEEILQLARSSSETIAVAAVNTLQVSFRIVYPSDSISQGASLLKTVSGRISQVLLADAKLSTSFPIFFEQAVIIALDSMRSSSWAGPSSLVFVLRVLPIETILTRFLSLRGTFQFETSDSS